MNNPGPALQGAHTYCILFFRERDTVAAEMIQPILLAIALKYGQIFLMQKKVSKQNGVKNCRPHLIWQYNGH